jgi:hypothetical protein
MFGLQDKKGYSSFKFFFFLLKKSEERKAHNMFSLMLDPRFKTFQLVSSLGGHEQDKAIVDEYDKKYLYHFLKMLLSFPSIC